MKNLTVDFVSGRIIATNSFMKKASIPFSEEFEELTRLMKRLPNYRMEILKVKRTYHPVFRPSYNQMRSFIETQPNRMELMEKFEKVVSESRLYHNAYARVLDWFTSNFSGINSTETELFDVA